MITDSMLPVVPEQGTVGASGDLAPLSHLALGITLGEGKMWSPKSGLADASLVRCLNVKWICCCISSSVASG